VPAARPYFDAGPNTCNSSSVCSTATGLVIFYPLHLFTAGRVNVSDSTTRAIVRRSLDQGSSWETVLDVPPAEGASANYFNDLALGPNGEVYALHLFSPPFSGRVWRTIDQGQTWQEMTRPPDGYLYRELDCGGDGTFYTCAVFDDGNQVIWHTLKGEVTNALEGTASWSLVDTLEGDSATPLVLATRPGQSGADATELWVGGWQRQEIGETEPTTAIRWQMRRSVDDGATWTTTRWPNAIDWRWKDSGYSTPWRQKMIGKRTLPGLLNRRTRSGAKDVLCDSPALALHCELRLKLSRLGTSQTQS